MVAVPVRAAFFSWLYQIRQKRVETWRGAAANGRSKKKLLFRCNTWVSVRRVLSEQSVQVLIWNDKIHVARATGWREENYVIKKFWVRSIIILMPGGHSRHSNFLSHQTDSRNKAVVVSSWASISKHQIFFTTCKNPFQKWKYDFVL